MFLQIPEVESRISGMSASCTLLSENIAVEHQEHILLDEHLQIVVEHDGSNPFCDLIPCCWGLIVVAAATERTPTLTVDDEHPFDFHCLPRSINITKVIIAEADYCDVRGIWLLIETTDDSGDEDFGISLVAYSTN
jgi:hypothetical protein